MLSVRVAAALARALPRRAGFVSIFGQMTLTCVHVAVRLFSLSAGLARVKGNVTLTTQAAG